MLIYKLLTSRLFRLASVKSTLKNFVKDNTNKVNGTLSFC
jgi:hypothetical protein